MKTISPAYRPRLATPAATTYRSTPPPEPVAPLRPHALPESPPAFWQNRRLLEFGRPA